MNTDKQSRNIEWTKAVDPITDKRIYFEDGKGRVCYWSSTDATIAQKTLSARAAKLKKSTGPTIEGCEGWPHKNLREDFEAGANIWREVSEQFYDEMLGALPPIDQAPGRFLVGEPYCDRGNDTIYCGCVAINGRYFARYVPRRAFVGLINELRAVLS